MVDVRKDGDGKALLSPEKEKALAKRFLDLACVMERLRRDCPWDQAQTPQSLRRYILEEAYEVLEAIDNEDWAELCDELGDFTLQVVFQAKIQAESERFDLEDVLKGIVEKMVRRHPHVFSETKVADAEEVAANWEAIKQREKGGAAKASALDGLPKGLPALMESYKLTRKASKVGFDWPTPEDVYAKIEEEMAEAQEAAETGSQAALAEELGDLLFAVANLTRKYGFEPEETLRLANRKFRRRFKAMESLAKAKGKPFASLGLEDQEALWQASKLAEKA